MTTKRTLARRLGTTAFAVALGASLTVVAAGTAHAAFCTLGISAKNSSGNYQIGVSCDGNPVDGFSLYGQDQFFDEFRGHFIGTAATVSVATLNEDDSIFDREDDIYAKVGDSMTNVIHRRF
jgi:hypothetical protein